MEYLAASQQQNQVGCQPPAQLDYRDGGLAMK